MKFAIGSRAYGKNSPFLAESDCFLIACVKKKPSMRLSREKGEGIIFFAKTKKSQKDIDMLTKLW